VRQNLSYGFGKSPIKMIALSNAHNLPLKSEVIMTKKAELQKWMKRKGIFATHDVIKWGSEHYLDRADRYKREFQQQGLIRKLTDYEKKMCEYTCKDAVYVWIRQPEPKQAQVEDGVQQELFVR